MTRTALAADEPEPYRSAVLRDLLTGRAEAAFLASFDPSTTTTTTLGFTPVLLDPTLIFDDSRDPIRTTAWVDRPKAIEP